jgi:C4-dicarboxylate transporter DctQ subunit
VLLNEVQVKKRILEAGIERLISLVGSVLLLAISVLTLVQVFLRYVARIPLVLAQEFIQFLFIWLVWFGAILAVPLGAHMAIGFFRDRLFSGKMLFLIRILMLLLSMALMSVMAIKGYDLSESLAMEFFTTFPVSIKYKYLSSAVGGALVLYYLCLELWKTVSEFLHTEKK